MTIAVTRLSDDAYRATFEAPMLDVTREDGEALDIWPYVASVPSADMQGATLRDVEFVYRSATGRYDHVLIASDVKSLYLAVVVDNEHAQVHGHQVLDLNLQYGLLPGVQPAR